MLLSHLHNREHSRCMPLLLLSIIVLKGTTVVPVQMSQIAWLTRRRGDTSTACLLTVPARPIRVESSLGPLLAIASTNTCNGFYRNRIILATSRVSFRKGPLKVVILSLRWRLTVCLINYSQNVYKHCAKKEHAMTNSNGDAKHCSFPWALYPMLGTMQLGDSKQNWRGTKLEMVRQIWLCVGTTVKCHLKI